MQSDIDAIQSDWSTVKSDASNLSDANQQALDSAWDSFQSSVSDLTGGSGSTEDVQNAAKGLESAVQANADSYDCGLASPTTTSSVLSSVLLWALRPVRRERPRAQQRSRPQ